MLSKDQEKILNSAIYELAAAYGSYYYHFKKENNKPLSDASREKNKILNEILDRVIENDLNGIFKEIFCIYLHGALGSPGTGTYLNRYN